MLWGKESKMAFGSTLLQHPSSSYFLGSMIWFTPFTCSLSAYDLYLFLYSPETASS
jgi:hypothetical protein